MLAKIFLIVCLCGFSTAQDMIIYVFGSYTFIAGNPVNQYEARQACEEDNKQLVKIDTTKKWKEVKDITSKLKKRQSQVIFWTSGLIPPEQEDIILSTENGILINENFWKQDTSSHNDNMKLCISVFTNASSGARLKSSGCDRKNEYLCENIESEDDRVNNIMYINSVKEYTITIVGDKSLNYFEAIKACKEDGNKDLVNIENEPKWKIIHDIITRLGYIGDGQPKELFWTAAEKLQNEDRFAWTKGKELPTNASYWGPDQPNYIDEQQDCVSIEVFDGGILGLNDWYCDSKIGYICENKKTKH